MKEIFNSESMQALVEKGMDLGIEAGKSIIVAVVIYFVGKALISLVNRMLSGMMERRNVDPAIQSFVKSLANILLMILLAISVVSALGVNTTSFAALLASGGVAVGMALSGNLQNLAGGIVILLFRPFKVGDFIEAQGVAGTVKQIQIFNTLLTTGDNKIIIVPNAKLSNDMVVNYSKGGTRRVDWTFTISYGDDYDKAKAVLTQFMSEDKRIKQDPAPFVALNNLADSAVEIVVRAWVDGGDYWDVYFAVNQRVKQIFDEQHIAMTYPHLNVHLDK